MDPDTEYRQLIRHRHPKRSGMHKIHRWRHTYEDDNLITKVIIAEFGENPQAIQAAKYEVQWPPFDNKDYMKIVTEIDNDWTGLSSGVCYSQKKKRRWLLPDLLEQELPIYDDYYLPYELTTKTISRFHRHHTHCCTGVFWFPQQGFGQYQLRALADSVKYFRMENREETNVVVKGAASLSIINDLYKVNKAKDTSSPKLHIHFQTVQFKKVPRKHNSRVYDYHPSWEENWDDPPVYEAHHVGKDVSPSGYLYKNDSHFYEGCDYLHEDEEFSTPTEHCDVVKDPSRPCFQFGAFFNVHNIPKRRTKKSKCDLNDWVRFFEQKFETPGGVQD